MILLKNLEKYEIKYAILKGTINRINKIIDDYSTGKIKIILLNSQYFGSGLNLQMTTDLIIYHKLEASIEKQAIGRAQRLGRKTPLNLIYLHYQGEENYYMN